MVSASKLLRSRKHRQSLLRVGIFGGEAGIRQRRTSRVGTGSPQAPPRHGCALRHQGAVQTVVPLAAAAGTGSAGRRHCHCVFRGNFAVIPVICKKMVSTFL